MSRCRIAEIAVPKWNSNKSMRHSPKSFLLRLAFAACLSMTVNGFAFGQMDDDAPTPPQDAKPVPPKGAPEPKKDENKTKLEEYDKTLKDLKRIDGPFPMYQRKKDLLVEVPDSALGKLFLVQATLSTGASATLQAGDPVGDTAIDVFRWEKQDNQLLILRPNLKFRWSKDDPLKVASDRSFPEANLGNFRIEAYNPEKKINLINISSFLFGEPFKLNELVNLSLGGQYMLDRDHSGVEAVKGYPDNTIVQEKLHFASPHGGEANPLMALLGFTSDNQLEDTRSVPLKITYNFWYRKDDGYMPRLSDPRIGYFTEEFYSMDRFLNEDRTERYIMRFNLQKKDPTKALSEPVKPIVWILDSSIPIAYRDAVKRGILRWNKAFEQAGFKDAIQVQDPPADFDHSDGRFNVVRWTVSPSAAYSVALFRTDPFTGEVLNASVTFDANYLAWVMNEHQTFVTPSAGLATKSLEALTRLSDPNEPADEMIWEPDKARARQELEKAKAKYGWHSLECEQGKGLAESASFGWAALNTIPNLKISKEEYAKEFIADTISHEIGHCLGLRHNFEASTNLTTAQLADDSLTSNQGIAASVMDYTPVNIQAVLRGHGNFFMPTVGPYDDWAIQYGYSPVAMATTPLGERPSLSKIASQSGLPGHAYMSDENVNRWDPYVVQYDNGKDPVNYSEKLLEAAARTRRYAVEKLDINGESFDKRTRLVLQSLLEVFRQGRMSARFVGGIRGSRSFVGDAGAAPTLNPVNGTVQRQAMHLIAKNCFMPDSLRLSKQVMLNLSVDPAQDGSANWTAPLRDITSRFEDMLYASLMSADTTDRIVENSYKLEGAKDAYTIQEHFSSILGAVFREVGENKSVEPTRRDLQRFAVSALIVQAGAPQGQIAEDVRMLASDSLRRLSARFGSQLHSKANLDEMTVIHLRDTKDQMDRFLNRQVLSR